MELVCVGLNHRSAPVEVRERYDVSSMRCAIHAAAPCPVEVKQRMIDWWGPVIEEYYSSTEAAGYTKITSAEWLERPGSVGRSAGLPFHVCDEDGRELPPGEPGLIYAEMAPGTEVRPPRMITISPKIIHN